MLHGPNVQQPLQAALHGICAIGALEKEKQKPLEENTAHATHNIDLSKKKENKNKNHWKKTQHNVTHNINLSKKKEKQKPLEENTTHVTHNIDLSKQRMTMMTREHPTPKNETRKERDRRHMYI